MAVEPWDQLPAESDAAFARFAIYRGLGPGRSLMAAYRVYLDMSPDTAPKSTKRQAPGSWHQECAQHEWVRRAQAWDVHTISSSGPELVACWVELLRIAVRKALSKLTDDRCKPTTFAQCLAVVGAIAPYLSPELVAAFATRQRQPEPPDSCPLDRLRPEDVT
jgi:hypothetical protein